MSCVFQNIDPPPPSPPGECVPPPLCCGGRTHSLGGEGGGGSIFWKTQDTAMYYTYIESSLRKTQRKKENVFNQKSLGSGEGELLQREERQRKTFFCAKKHKKSFS
jgi:hypothetical protein